MQTRFIFTSENQNAEFKVAIKSYTVIPAVAIREVTVPMETQHVSHGNMYHRRRSFRPRWASRLLVGFYCLTSDKKIAPKRCSYNILSTLCNHSHVLWVFSLCLYCGDGVLQLEQHNLCHFVTHFEQAAGFFHLCANAKTQNINMAKSSVLNYLTDLTCVALQWSLIHPFLRRPSPARWRPQQAKTQHKLNVSSLRLSHVFVFCFFKLQKLPGFTSPDRRTTSACITRRGVTLCSWAVGPWSTFWPSATEASETCWWENKLLLFFFPLLSVEETEGLKKRRVSLFP